MGFFITTSKLIQFKITRLLAQDGSTSGGVCIILTYSLAKLIKRGNQSFLINIC